MNCARTALATVLGLGMLAASCAPQQKPHARHVAARTPPAPLYSIYIPWGEHSVDTRLAEIGPKVRRRWKRDFEAAGISYPAASVELVAFKRERHLEVYAGPSPYSLSLVRTIPITAASGGPGPKLHEGDKQVPEGVYEVDSLNPNSNFHVALRLAYPNSFDQRMADADGRRKLGSAIMIHGGDQSVGCLAVGDQAAEDLFVIAADAGIEHVTVVIVPRDFRRTGETEPMPGQPPWVRELYAQLELKLRSLPEPPPASVQHPPANFEGGLTAR